MKTVKSVVDIFTLVDDPSQCHVFITDVHTLHNQSSINMLIIDSGRLTEYKYESELNGFDHYVIFSALSFLKQRIKNALLRQWSIFKKKDQSVYIGVRALLTLEKSRPKKESKLPLIQHFIVTSSRDRKPLAEGLEKFFSEIARMTGIKNSALAQNAIDIQEELLLNAIWDANPKRACQPRAMSFTLEPQEEVVVQWAFNGKEFALSVQDPFGRMDPTIMGKYINFIFKTGKPCEHELSKQTVSAGLGLYMIIQRANLLSVFISNGRITDFGVVLIVKSGKNLKTMSSKAIDIIQV